MIRLIRLFSVTFVFATLMGCSTPSKVAHHHDQPEFEGKCAYNVAHGKHDVSGKPEFQVNYKGKVYLFSEADMKDHFIAEIESNIATANQKWKVAHDHEHGRK